MNIANRKKRILYYHLFGGEAGGSDTCLYLLLKYLDRSIYEPFLLHLDKSRLLEELEAVGINIIPIPERIRVRLYCQMQKSAEALSSPPQKDGTVKSILKRLGSFGLFLSGMKDVIKRLPQTLAYIVIILKHNIDIVHTNHYLTGDRPMLLAAILLRKKIVSHNRGLYTPDIIDRFLVKYIDQIVSMSDFSTSVYVKGGIPETKSKTIYDGIDLEKFISSAPENEKIIISCVGRIEKWKGQQVLVEAAPKIIRKFKDIKFLFVGAGNNENNIRMQVKNNNLEKYFEFTGHITNVNYYINKSTLIVHTSIEPEPFGMVITEAMALEKPVIATNFGGPLEIIDNGIDGFLIPPGNPQILAEYITKLIDDASLRERIGKKAREKVIKKFDVRNYVKQIEAVYEEVSH